jgi:aldose 1-epimerase
VAWAVTARTASSLTCTIDVQPDAALGDVPFAFRASYDVAVSEARLEARLRLRSTAKHDQPISAGWHPYLQRDPGCRLHIPASSLWELDASAEPLPTGRVVPVSDASDFRTGRELGASEHWDATFTGLGFENGRAQCGLESHVVRVGADQRPAPVSLRRLVQVTETQGEAHMGSIQLYTAPGRAAIAVEPFSAPPDAVNLLARGHTDTGLVRLRPDEEVTFAMALVLEVQME